MRDSDSFRHITGTIDTDYDEDDDDDHLAKSRQLKALAALEREELEKQKQRAREAFVVLLSSIAFTSFSYNSVLSNLMLFLNMNPLHWDADHANTLLFVFMCIGCFFAVFSGWLTDNRFSLYSVIICGHIPYLTGLVLFVILGLAQKNFLDKVNPTSDLVVNKTMLESMCMVTDAKNTSDFLMATSPNCEYFVYTALIILSAGVGTLNVNMPLFLLAQVSVHVPCC